MKAKTNIHLIEIPFGGNDGIRWNSLHSEREDLCETIAKEKLTSSMSASTTQTSNNERNQTTNWHRALLQARLKKLDDALDRLISGAYGNCLTCSKRLEDAALKIDPAIGFCASCWADEQRQTGQFVDQQPRSVTKPPELMINSLARFDTIVLKTRNSVYRILMLDPNTGRCLVEGGEYCAAPVEAIVSGSVGQGGPFSSDKISTGLRLEFWIDTKQLITSPIKLFHIQRHSDAEFPMVTTEAVH